MFENMGGNKILISRSSLFLVPKTPLLWKNQPLKREQLKQQKLYPREVCTILRSLFKTSFDTTYEYSNVCGSCCFLVATEIYVAMYIVMKSSLDIRDLSFSEGSATKKTNAAWIYAVFYTDQ